MNVGRERGAAPSARSAAVLLLLVCGDDGDSADCKNCLLFLEHRFAGNAVLGRFIFFDHTRSALVFFVDEFFFVKGK